MKYRLSEDTLFSPFFPSEVTLDVYCVRMLRQWTKRMSKSLKIPQTYIFIVSHVIHTCYLILWSPSVCPCPQRSLSISCQAACFNGHLVDCSVSLTAKTEETQYSNLTLLLMTTASQLVFSWLHAHKLFTRRGKKDKKKERKKQQQQRQLTKTMMCWIFEWKWPKKQWKKNEFFILFCPFCLSHTNCVNKMHFFYF